MRNKKSHEGVSCAQVYQNGPGLVRRDKYWGRSLDESGFKGALKRFFHSGRYLRVAVVRRVIAKLEELRRAIERQTSYRFYSCSLLVVYEGSPDANQACNSSDCEDILSCNVDGDSSLSHESHRRGFAEAAARGSSVSSSFVPISEETVFPDPSPAELRIDVGAEKTRSWMNHSSLSGPETSSDLDVSLESVSSGGSAGNKRSRLSPVSEGWTDFLTNSVSSDFEMSASSMSECTPTKRIRQHSHCSDSNIDDEDEDYEYSSSSVKSCSHLCEGCHTPPRVDVRMIDFAHTTCQGDPGPSTLHLGPDGGFLTGLDSLRRLLREILAEG